MDSRRRPRRYLAAHELGQFVYATEGARGRRSPRQEDLQRGLQVHARLQAAHMGRPPASGPGSPWGWVAVGSFLLLVLGVALWIR